MFTSSAQNWNWLSEQFKSTEQETNNYNCRLSISDLMYLFKWDRKIEIKRDSEFEVQTNN